MQGPVWDEVGGRVLGGPGEGFAFYSENSGSLRRVLSGRHWELISGSQWVGPNLWMCLGWISFTPGWRKGCRG